MSTAQVASFDYRRSTDSRIRRPPARLLRRSDTTAASFRGSAFRLTNSHVRTASRFSTTPEECFTRSSWLLSLPWARVSVLLQTTRTGVKPTLTAREPSWLLDSRRNLTTSSPGATTIGVLLSRASTQTLDPPDREPAVSRLASPASRKGWNQANASAFWSGRYFSPTAPRILPSESHTTAKAGACWPSAV